MACPPSEILLEKAYGVCDEASNRPAPLQTSPAFR
jgi:hypothetical protein